MDYPILRNVLILLTLVLIVSVIFRYLRLPVILGYLVIGALLGPHAMGVMEHIENAQRFAQFGVVCLMFSVGLEFSLPKMIALRKEVFFLGGLQVSITVSIIMLIGKLFDIHWSIGLIIGGIVAMSSTAIVAKQLSDQLEMHHRYAQNAVAILLFQDLAVVPFLILIASLTKQQPELVSILSLALIKGVGCILAILAIGRWLFRPIFHTIAATHVIELFTLAVLLVPFAAAWLTHSLGLSFALGAFVAGMMLGETRFRHQIEAEIRPFRDMLMGLFFVCIGALLNFTTWHDTWLWIAGLFIAIVIGKSSLIMLLSYLFRVDRASALRTGLVLAQGGEFSFAMLTLASSNHLLSAYYSQIVLGALLLSIAFAPLLIAFNMRIAEWFFPKTMRLSQQQQRQAIDLQVEQLKNHVILCGYGAVGQNIARFLEKKKIDYMALDLDPNRIHDASLVGKPLSYGDATRLEILKAAGIMYAKALVIAFEDTLGAQKILQYVQSLHPRLPTFVRCKNDFELAKLRGYGAAEIIVESHEESLMLTYHLLLALRISRAEVDQLIDSVRKNHTDLLEQVFADSAATESSEASILIKQLHPVILSAQSCAVGKTLVDLNLEQIDVRVVAVRRNSSYYANPHGNMKLHADDIILLYGMWEDLDQAEEILLRT